MNAAVGLMDGLGLDGDRCIRVIPRHLYNGAKTKATSLPDVFTDNRASSNRNGQKNRKIGICAPKNRKIIGIDHYK